jgi:hypothetical protein
MKMRSSISPGKTGSSLQTWSKNFIETHGNDRATLNKAAKALRELKLTPHQQPRRVNAGDRHLEQST